MQLKDYTPLRLTEKNETILFDCDDEDLNDFIRNDAWNYQAELLSVTYLFEDKKTMWLPFFLWRMIRLKTKILKNGIT